MVQRLEGTRKRTEAWSGDEHVVQRRCLPGDPTPVEDVPSLALKPLRADQLFEEDGKSYVCTLDWTI
jgi:hypothetical protein